MLHGMNWVGGPNSKMGRREVDGRLGTTMVNLS